MSAPTGTTAPHAAPGATRAHPEELARWAWRQLTSMRTALILLFLLALAAVPGSIIPQRDVDAIAVSRWQDAHPGPTPVYDALGLFSVYDSVWFSAIYILLMVSLAAHPAAHADLLAGHARAAPQGAAEPVPAAGVPDVHPR